MVDVKEDKSLQVGSESKRTTSELILWINEDLNKLPATIHARFDWARDDSSVVWASVRYDHPALLHKLNPRTVLSFVPPNGRVWFVLGTDETRNHIEMLHYLGSMGLRFQGSATFSKKDSRILQGGLIIGGTNDSLVIQNIFNIYWMDWVANGHLFFIDSDQDLGERQQELQSLPSLIHRQFLDRVSCVLATYYDHGMEIISSRLKSEQIESTLRSVASEFNLSVRVKTEESKKDVEAQSAARKRWFIPWAQARKVKS